MATIPTAVLVPHKLNLTTQAEALSAARACCLLDPMHVQINALDSLPGFLLQLKRDQLLSSLLADPMARVVVLSTLSHAIKSILDARRELTDVFPLLEKALWLIYVDKFEASFLEAVEHLGELSRSSLDESPVWTLKKTRQSFVVLTPNTAPVTSSPWYLLRAETHWRNKERPSTAHMSAVHPSAPYTPLQPRRPISVQQAASRPSASQPPSSPPRALSSSSPPPFKKA